MRHGSLSFSPAPQVPRGVPSTQRSVHAAAVTVVLGGGSLGSARRRGGFRRCRSRRASRGPRGPRGRPVFTELPVQPTPSGAGHAGPRACCGRTGGPCLRWHSPSGVNTPGAFVRVPQRSRAASAAFGLQPGERTAPALSQGRAVGSGVAVAAARCVAGSKPEARPALWACSHLPPELGKLVPGGVAAGPRPDSTD